MDLDENVECSYKPTFCKTTTYQEPDYNEHSGLYGKDIKESIKATEFRSEVIRRRFNTSDLRTDVEKPTATKHGATILERSLSNASITVSQPKLKKDARRLSGAFTRNCCVRAPERTESVKNYGKRPPPQKTVRFDGNSTRKAKYYETMNQRCMQLYEAAIRNIKVQNERKEKALKDKRRSAESIGAHRIQNNGRGKKLYDLHKDNNAVGKKRREAIKKTIEAKPTPLVHSAKSGTKASRSSEKGIQCKSTKTSSGSKRGAQGQISRYISASNRSTSSRNTIGYNRSTILRERALLTLKSEKQVKEKKTSILRKGNCASPRLLHLYETGTQKIKMKKSYEANESMLREKPTKCIVSGTNRRCRELYQLSTKAQKLGRQRRDNIKTMTAAIAKSNGSFRLT